LDRKTAKKKELCETHFFPSHTISINTLLCDDDDDDEGRINFSMALSPKTTRTRNNKLKSCNSSQRNETFLVNQQKTSKTATTQ